MNPPSRTGNWRQNQLDAHLHVEILSTLGTLIHCEVEEYDVFKREDCLESETKPERMDRSSSFASIVPWGSTASMQVVFEHFMEHLPGKGRTGSTRIN